MFIQFIETCAVTVAVLGVLVATGKAVSLIVGTVL